MTRDQIDELMRENGIVVVGEAVYALVQLVIKHEREACAKLCDEQAEDAHVETQTLRAALEAAVAWAAPMADAPKISRPEWFDQARAALSHKGPIK